MPTRHFVNDDGGVGDDSTDNAAAFLSFRTWARAQVGTVTLTIPAGNYVNSMHMPFDGISSLIVNGAGPTTTKIKYNSVFRLTTQCGFVQRDNFHAAVATVAPGATSVTCLTVAQAARFTVGRWAALAALEYQGVSGYPPNHHHIEFVKIVSNNATTGVVDFESPVTDTYSQNYPSTWNGTFTGGNYATGGPAMLFLLAAPLTGGSLDTAWDCDVEFNDFNVTNIMVDLQAEEQVYLNGRNVVLNNMTFTDCAPIPTQNKYVEFNGVTVPDVQVEVDKEVEHCVITGASDITQVRCQSSSVKDLTISGTTHIGSLIGTPTNAIIRGSGVVIDSMQIGTNGFGVTDSVYAENCTISAISAITTNRLDVSTFTVEQGGSVTYGNSFGTGGLTWGAEGAQLFLAGQISGGSNHAHIGFPTWIREVQDASGDAKFLCWLKATAPSFLTGTVYLVQHPCANVTFHNVTGCAEALDLSRAPDGLPLYSYIKRIDQTFETGQTIKAWGYLKYIKINVTRAYTGAQATCDLHIGHIDANSAAPTIDADGVTGGYNRFHGHIDCKTTGERIITPTSITGSVGSDNLGAAPGAIYFMDTIAVDITENISGDTEGQKPLITFEMLTDQFQKVGRLI